MAMNPTNGMAAGQPGTGNPFAGRSGQVPAAQDVQGENITEAEDRDEFNADHLAGLMATTPTWAKGLPLAAAGFEAYRYRKD